MSQVKAAGRYVWWVYKVVLTFESVDEILKCQWMPYKVFLTFEYLDQIVKCDHSDESYWAVPSFRAFFYAVQGGSSFWVCGWNHKVRPFKWELLNESNFWVWMKSWSVTIQTKAILHEESDHPYCALTVLSLLWCFFHGLGCRTFLTLICEPFHLSLFSPFYALPLTTQNNNDKQRQNNNGSSANSYNAAQDTIHNVLQ